MLCKGEEAGGAIGQPKVLELLKVPNGNTAATNQGSGGGGGSRGGAGGGGGGGQGYGRESPIPSPCTCSSSLSLCLFSLCPSYPIPTIPLLFFLFHPPFLSLPPFRPPSLPQPTMEEAVEVLLPPPSHHLDQPLLAVKPDLVDLPSHPTPRMCAQYIYCCVLCFGLV